MLNTKFSPWPKFEEDEIEAVTRVLASGKVNAWTGTEIAAFEKEFAEFVGTSHAIAVANGSVSLEIALRGLGIGAGDEVIVTSRTFLASASSIVNVGAVPVFADVELDSQNISARTIEGKIGEKTKAIICVHLAGWPCEMEEIMRLAARHDLKVIEDCAQAHGAAYKGQSVGSFGDVASWSFCQDKVMSTGGEGGMLTTDDHALYERMWSYKDHGKSIERVKQARSENNRRFKWLHTSFGTNLRMTQMQAAIGRIQLRKLPEWTKIRQAHAALLDAVVDASAVVTRAPIPEYIEHAYYKYYFFVEPEHLAPGWTRDRIVEAMWQQNVPCLGGSCSEIYNEAAFDGTGWRPSQALSNAKRLGERSLMMLVHPTLSRSEMDKMAETLRTVLQSAGQSARVA